MSNFDQTAEIFQFFGDSSFADMECSDLSLLRLPRLPLLWRIVATYVVDPLCNGLRTFLDARPRGISLVLRLCPKRYAAVMSLADTLMQELGVTRPS